MLLMQVQVGVVLSGGQAAGGHNAISGIFDFLQARNPANLLFGFLGGPIGVVNGEYIALTEDLIAHYRNQVRSMGTSCCTGAFLM